MSKIILSGGGTLGPVVPLLGIREMYRSAYPETEFLWVGTKHGPEKEVVTEAGVRFVAIEAGKWRRYFSIYNLFDVFNILMAFWRSLVLLHHENPQLLISCGGFVSVPLHWAAWWLGIPAWVHQQDVRVGLANKLMFPIADKITTALQKTAGELPKDKTEWLGNPVRDLSGFSQIAAKKSFNIPINAPTIFALGGGTGSASVNRLILEVLPLIPADWHIIHLTGKERQAPMAEQATSTFPNYHVWPFFTHEMKNAYAAADIVVARAGFATLSELAALHKPAVIIPMFDTHQEDNARAFAEQGGVIMLRKGEGTGLKLASVLKGLIDNARQREALGNTLAQLLPVAVPERVVQIIDQLHK